MNTDPMRPGGFTILELLVSMALLTIGVSGILGGMVIATQSNALSRRRTQMAEFAQSRIERLASRRRPSVPTSATVLPVNCTSMNPGGTFDPNVTPGTGGWMLDVIDGTPPAGGGAAGDDLMAGPLLLEGDLSGLDSAATLSRRATLANAWFANTDTAGCGSATVSGDIKVFCREIHVEPLTVAGVPILRAWVRVVQGGASWRTSFVVFQQDLAQ